MSYVKLSLSSIVLAEHNNCRLSYQCFPNETLFTSPTSSSPRSKIGKGTHHHPTPLLKRLLLLRYMPIIADYRTPQDHLPFVVYVLIRGANLHNIFFVKGVDNLNTEGLRIHRCHKPCPCLHNFRIASRGYSLFSEAPADNKRKKQE